MEKQKLPILVVAATGHLGGLIVRECLQNDNLLVNILVRDPSRNPELCEEVKKHGGRVLQGDVEEPETITDCTKGIHTVISCLAGEDIIVVDGQLILLNDAIHNGVRRFVPSDFSLDYTQVPDGGHELSQQRRTFRKALQATSIQGLHIHVGWFIETYIWTMNYMGKGLGYWGFNPDQKLDFSTFPDVAKYIAAAVAQPERAGDLYLCTAGELSTNEVAHTYSQVVSETIQPIRLGTFDELREIQSETKKVYLDRKAKGEIGLIRHINDMAEPDYFWGIFLGYQYFLFRGIGKLPQNDIKEFPEIKPVSFEEFLKQNDDQRIKLTGIDEALLENVSEAFQDFKQKLIEEKDVLVEQFENAEKKIIDTKDVLIGKLENAVHFLTLNASHITTEIKAKIAHVLSSGDNADSSANL